MEETLPEKHPYWAYIISSIVASIGYLMVHVILNNGVDWNVYFMWLPVVWFMVLVLAFIFGLIHHIYK